MQRTLMLLFLAGLVLVGLMAFKTYKGAILGGENNQYPTMTASQDFYSLSAQTLDGGDFSFEQLRGKRVLIVNTASRCGYTPQYTKLQALFDEHGGDDFVILGFPCNQFGRQEPGSSDEIGAFCSKNYGVTFQMMEKVEVKGDGQHPVYTWLCDVSQNGAGDHKVAWNFHKFLVDEEGRLKASLKSGVDPLGDEISAFAAGK
ncbi:glutathione peroxidase [Flavobacteriales bacterium]|nr:glutathione peroxidase [Flavobacteriales bacterium]